MCIINKRYGPDKLRTLYITSVHFHVASLKLPNMFLLLLLVYTLNGGGRISYYFVLPNIHPTLRETQKSLMPQHADLTGLYNFYFKYLSEFCLLKWMKGEYILGVGGTDKGSS
jgi:hypothetical protein